MIHGFVQSSGIPDPELLSRFVFFGDHIRSTGEVKADAFIPPPSLDLSVTRHDKLSSHEVWVRGEAVAIQRDRPMLARADLPASAVRGSGLEPKPEPTTENPEHAVIVGWPPSKPLQKSQAQLLARAAVCLKRAE
jgi:hypothetical protein